MSVLDVLDSVISINKQLIMLAARALMLATRAAAWWLAHDEAPSFYPGHKHCRRLTNQGVIS